MRNLLHAPRLLVAILAMGLVTMAARPMTDPDVWWHLRTGQLILQTHSIPHVDPFSFTRAGQPWVNHEWLSDVLIYGVYRMTNWAGLIVGFAGVTAAAFLLVFFRSPGRPYLAALMTIWGAAASAPSWGVRPQMLSLLLASIFLWILDRSADRPRILWWTVPLTLLWVNLHAGYAIGIGLLLLYLLGTLLDVTFGFATWKAQAARIRTLIAVLVMCLAIVPLNPNGLRMYSYPFETLRSRAMQAYIAEWFSPDFHQAKYLPLVSMLLVLLVALALSKTRVPPRELLLLAVTTWAALRSVRHIPIFALIAVPILSRLMYGWLETTSWYSRLNRPPGDFQRGKLAFNAIMLLAFMGFTGIRINSVTSHQAEVESTHFPTKAAAFLSATRPPAPIMNHYNWGGYLIWKVYPEYRVFLDGRADLYGDAMMDEFAAMYYLKDDWQKPLRDWQIQTILLPPDAPLITGLRVKGEWQQVYADSQAAILARPQGPAATP